MIMYIAIESLYCARFVGAFIHFRARVSSRGGCGSAALGELGIPHGQQQSQIVLLASHQDGTKQGRRCSQPTWSLDDIWATFPCVASKTVLSLKSNFYSI